MIRRLILFAATFAILVTPAHADDWWREDRRVIGVLVSPIATPAPLPGPINSPITQPNGCPAYPGMIVLCCSVAPCP